MSEHPIQGLMRTAMENIRQMVDVNTIVGDPVSTPDGSVILPISKVGFGFAAGGSEFVVEHEAAEQHLQTENQRLDSHNAIVSLPFGGGSGGGVSITPIAFLVVGQQGIRVVPLDNQTHIFERLIESAPQVVDKIQSMLKGNKSTNDSMQQQAGSPTEGSLNATSGSANGMTGTNGTTIITNQADILI